MPQTLQFKTSMPQNAVLFYFADRDTCTGMPSESCCCLVRLIQITH